MNNIPNNEAYLLISEWLETYHSDCDERKKIKVKNLIVMQMIPVVKRIAKTIARRETDPIEDLVQAGFVGLLKAIDTYSKEKNDNFRVYAGYYIIGEMKHFLRDKLNTIKVPRHIQELNIRINGFINTLTQEEVQRLTIDDVATALHLSNDVVNYAMEMDRRRSTLSLDEIFKLDDECLGYEELFSSNGYVDVKDYTDERIIFKDIISKLPDESRQILEMYYNKDMTQKDIAESFGWSQMQISRKLKRIFSQINKIVVEKEYSKNNEEL